MVRILSLLLLAAACTAAALTVDPALSEGRVTGELLPGWRENSGWAKAWVHYTVERENGREFQRIDVRRLENGYCQFDFRLPPDFEAGTWRLSFRARQQGRARLNTGIRMVNAPFRWLFKEAVSPEQEWGTFSRVFTLRSLPKGEPLSIFMQFNGTATLDLRDVELVPAEPEAGEGGNLFRQHSLALGLPAAWSWQNCFSDGEHVTFSKENGEIGPSGMPPLKIEVRSGVMTSYDYRDSVTVCSAPLLTPPAGRRLTAGMMLKGAASGELAVRCGSRMIARRPFELKPEEGWKRVAAEFIPSQAGILTVELTFRGTLWCDALYAGLPERLAEAAREGWTELAPEKGKTAAAGIVFAGEPVRVRLLSKTAPGAKELEVKAVNLYGDAVSRRIPFPGDRSVLRNTVTRELPAARRLGPWRVEAIQLDVSGKPVDVPAVERVVNVLPRPVYWGKDAPDSPFGIHVQPVNRHLTMAKAIGANWARLHDAGVQLLGWAYLERKPGEWSFDDDGVRRYRKHHLKLLGELTTAPSFRSHAVNSSVPYPTLRQSVTSPYFLPLSMREYGEYCERIITRYGGSIDAFDVWNEPWLPLFFHIDYVKKLPGNARRWASFGGGFYLSPDDPAAEFYKMQRQVRQAVRNSGSRARVLGVNTTDGLGHEGRVPGREFSQRMAELGAAEDCDAISYHQYLTRLVGFPGDEVEQGYERAIGPIREHHGKLPRPVWFTEGSPLNEPCDGFYRTIPPGASRSEIFDTGDRVVRFVTALLGCGAEKVFLYSMGLHNGYGTLNPHRLLITAAGELHPSAAAYANLTSVLEGKAFVRRLPVGILVHAYIFSDGRRSTAVLLPDPACREAAWKPEPSEQWHASDLFGNAFVAGSPYASFVTGTGSADELENYLKQGK